MTLIPFLFLQVFFSSFFFYLKCYYLPVSFRFTIITILVVYLNGLYPAVDLSVPVYDKPGLRSDGGQRGQQLQVAGVQQGQDTPVMFLLPFRVQFVSIVV